MAEEKEHATLMDVLNKVIIIGGAAGILWGGGIWVYDMTSLVATKEYHDSDRQEVVQEITGLLQTELEPIKKSAENSEAGAVVRRIQNILDLKCRTEIPMEVEQILQAQLDRYRELMNRDFNVGGCKNGKRVTAYEMENPPEVDHPQG